MAGPDPLDVWLYGVRVAELREPRTRKLSLAYTDEAMARWSFGQPVLSISMPLQPRPYPSAVAMPFFEGLLPEGDARDRLEHRYGVARGDVAGLLREVGRDCAGAIVIQPRGHPAPTPPTTEPPALSPDDLIAMLAELPEHPLGGDDAVRLSLAGQQEKLVLARRRDGRWARPLDGYPSTHILKPGDASYHDVVGNEAMCLRIARSLGLTDVEVEILKPAGVPVLTVSRYDRVPGPDGPPERLHQEDLCQALGIDVGRRPAAKYEEGGGPSLATVARLLDTWASPGTLERLVEIVTFNVAIGNADAHGKNLAIMLAPDGCRLAPLYDTVSTVAYETVRTAAGLERPVSTAAAMRVNEVSEIHAVTADDVVEEARRWPVADVVAGRLVADVLERLPAAIDEAAAATPEAPAALAETIRRRVAALAGGRAAGARQE